MYCGIILNLKVIAFNERNKGKLSVQIPCMINISLIPTSKFRSYCSCSYQMGLGINWLPSLIFWFLLSFNTRGFRSCCSFSLTRTSNLSSFVWYFRSVYSERLRLVTFLNPFFLPDPISSVMSSKLFHFKNWSCLLKSKCFILITSVNNNNKKMSSLFACCLTYISLSPSHTSILVSLLSRDVMFHVFSFVFHNVWDYLAVPRFKVRAAYSNQHDISSTWHSSLCIYQLRPVISILQMAQRSAKTRVREPTALMDSKGLHVVLSFFHQHRTYAFVLLFKSFKNVKFSLCLNN
jgi:hypothetical protein